MKQISLTLNSDYSVVKIPLSTGLDNYPEWILSISILVFRSKTRWSCTARGSLQGHVLCITRDTPLFSISFPHYCSRARFRKLISTLFYCDRASLLNWSSGLAWPSYPSDDEMDYSITALFVLSRPLVSILSILAEFGRLSARVRREIQFLWLLLTSFILLPSLSSLFALLFPFLLLFYQWDVRTQGVKSARGVWALFNWNTKRSKATKCIANHSRGSLYDTFPRH